MFLGDYLLAVCISVVSIATTGLAELHEGRLTFLVDSSEPVRDIDAADTLASKVAKAPNAVLDILKSVRIADSLDKALDVREQLVDLGVASSVIIPDGIWLSRDWLRVSRNKDVGAGILSREHEMRRLKDEIRELQARSDSATRLTQDGRTRLRQLEDLSLIHI